MDNKIILERRKTYLIGNGIGTAQSIEYFNKETKRIVEESNELRNTNYEKIINSVPLMKEFYEDILTMTKAYKTKGTESYLKDEIILLIIEQLKAGEKFFYNKDAKEHTNWWQWEIGIPLRINDIFILLKDEMDRTLMEEILTTTKYFQPDPRFSGNNPVALHPSNNPLRLSTGGNRTDTVKISFLRGILLEDEDEIIDSLEALPEVWEYKNDDELKEREGFYRDGSFIQHGSIAYNGGYGAVLLSGVGEILYLVGNTKYERYLSRIENFYEIVDKGFEPFFYKGLFPDFLNGRGIVREQLFDHVMGHRILNSLFLLSVNSPEKYRLKLGKMIKREIEKESFYKYFENENSVFFYNEVKKFMDEIDEKDFSYKDQLIICNNMNRVMKRTEDYALGISMHSYKVGNYEAMNGENLRGWFTGDGAYTFYDEDLGQYKNYWNEIDSHYIPGTTEIKMNMENIDAQRNSETKFIGNRLVGGVNFGSCGVVGMKYTNWNEKLSSRKSWYFLDWGVLFAETDITGTGEIYTTILNRRFDEIPKIKADDKNISLDKKIEIVAKEIEVVGKKYIFFKDEKVNIELEKNHGKYFLKIWVEHGLNPENKTLVWGIVTDKNKKYEEILKENELEISKDKISLKNADKIYKINWQCEKDNTAFCEIFEKDIKVSEYIVK